jgi:hypothetical protein
MCGATGTAPGVVGAKTAEYLISEFAAKLHNVVSEERKRA